MTLKLTPERAPAGRYLLREDRLFAAPFEAEVVEWSKEGRVKLRYASGHESWFEESGSTALMPWFVEALTNHSDLTEGKK